MAQQYLQCAKLPIKPLLGQTPPTVRDACGAQNRVLSAVLIPHLCDY